MWFIQQNDWIDLKKNFAVTKTFGSTKHILLTEEFCWINQSFLWPYPDKSFGEEFNRNKSEPFGIIWNKSAKRFVSRLMKSGQKLIWLNLIHSTSIRINPNYSRSEKFGLIVMVNLVWINLGSDWKLNLDWFGLMPRIESN